MKPAPRPSSGLGPRLEQLLRIEAEYAPRLCLKTLRLRLSIRQAIKELTV
ncbi:hypothetical protein [Stutzerimonas stutzeri]